MTAELAPNHQAVYVPTNFHERYNEWEKIFGKSASMKMLFEDFINRLDKYFATYLLVVGIDTILIPTIKDRIKSETPDIKEGTPKYNDLRNACLTSAACDAMEAILKDSYNDNDPGSHFRENFKNASQRVRIAAA